jgi:hypothetical protein
MGGLAAAVNVFFAGAIWAAVKAVATVAYVIYLWKQRKKANQSPTYGFDIQTQSSNELTIPVVYGRVKAGGNIVWQSMSPDKSTIYALVAFSEGPIEGFEDIRANDIPINELPGCSYTEYLGTPDQMIDSRVRGGNVYFYADPNYSGDWRTLGLGDHNAASLRAAGMVTKFDDGPYFNSWVSSVKTNGRIVTLYSGDNFNGYSWVLTEDAPWLGEADDGVYSVRIQEGPYSDAVKKVGGLRHVAYIAFTIAASDRISGGMPNFTAIVKGRKVRVWENESWVTKWTENPAWHLYDLLTHTRYGGGYTDNQINIEGLKTAAAFCDEILDDGQPRFTEGIIIDWVDSLPDIVDQIRFTCRGYVVSYNGRLTFKVEQPEEPCQHFSMENIVEDSLEIYMPGKDEEWQKVTVTYCEPGQNWAKLPAQSVDESNPLNPIKKDFTIVGVNRFSQASRLAYFYRVYSKYCRFSGKFKTTIRALNRIPGDVITITDDIMGWVEKPVRILEIRHAGDHIHEIYFREYNETIYTDALGSAEPTPNYSELPNPFAPPPDPTNLLVTESSYVQPSGEIMPEIRVTFTPGQCFNYSYSLVQLSEDGGETWQDKGQTLEGKTFISGVRANYNYLVRVKTVSQQNVQSDGVVSSITVKGKNQPPSDVPKLTITQNRGMLRATVTLVDDPDVEEYELRFGPTWDNSDRAIPNFRGPTSEEFEAPYEGTLTFWVKAVDRMGLKSAKATKAVIEVYNVPPKNYIYQKDENLANWTAQNMYLDPWGRWQIVSLETINDYDSFFDMFEDPTITLHESPQLILPTIDLGDKVLQPDCYYIDPWGVLKLRSVETIDTYETFFDMFEDSTLTRVTAEYIMTTFLGVHIAYNQGPNTRIDSYFHTRADGDQWSEWQSTQNKQFVGKRIEIRLNPVSLDRKTNVAISAATIEVDVPDVTERQTNIPVPVEGVHIKFKQRYWDPPLIDKLSTRKLDGTSATNRVINRTEKGCDIFILENGEPIEGVIEVLEVRGF